jgi:hypothetical protein
MERGSAQHGARIDEELSHESEALVHGGAIPSREREDLDPEALTADEESELATPPANGVAAADGHAPVHADLIARSELARWLLPSAFPATGATLAQVALGQGAPDGLPERLEALGEDPVFDTVGELWIALGGAHEERPSSTVEPEPAAPLPPEAELADTEPAPEPELVEVIDLDDPAEHAPPVVDSPSGGWSSVSALTPAIEDGAGLVVGSLVRLITLPPRVVIGVVHTVGGVVGRGIAALSASTRSSN